MSSLNDRDTAFETKYAHDQDLRFKVTNRRNKLLGLWAATRLGKTTAEAEAYAKEVVLSDFAEAGDDDVLKKVLADLNTAGVEITAGELRSTMDTLLSEAKQQLMAE